MTSTARRLELLHTHTLVQLPVDCRNARLMTVAPAISPKTRLVPFKATPPLKLSAYALWHLTPHGEGLALRLLESRNSAVFSYGVLANSFNCQCSETSYADDDDGGTGRGQEEEESPAEALRRW